MLNKLLSLLFIITTIILFISSYTGCAAKGVPSGGPVDKTSPEIIKTYPVPDSTNVRVLSVINFEFSEPMNESSIANSIFISPPLDFEAEWESYTELNITLKDSLKNNQTYVVVLGAKISDIRNNKLASSFQLAFSSGNKIDQGKISGRVYGLGRNQILTIFAFDLDSDTLRFDKNKPDYVSQTGDDGNFTLSYLKNANYRVFAVNDQNNNLLIDADLEKIAIPIKDVFLDTSAYNFAGLNFRVTKLDTIAPVLSNIRSKNSTQFDLRLSEKLTISSLDQISVIDSISRKTIEILATSESPDADNILEVYTSKMDSGKVYFCSVKALKDSSGNLAKDTTISFIAGKYVEPDTFKIINFTPQDSSWSLHPVTKIYLEFNNPVSKKSFEENFYLASKGKDTIAGRFDYPSVYEAEFSPESFLTLDSVYSINLDLSKIKNIWGDSLGDSLLLRYIKMNNGDDYGEISGTVFIRDSVRYPVFIDAARVGRKNEKYPSQISDKTSYLINNVPDGNYKMRAYLDKDSSGTYSGGHLFPFQFSEPFIFNTDTVKVRKRWETSGVKIILPGSN